LPPLAMQPKSSSMLKHSSPPTDFIHIVGARENNLRNVREGLHNMSAGAFWSE